MIDHSVQVDSFGTSGAFDINALLEFQRNRERYMLLRWGQTAFRNFRVVPPDTGIVHQVNLEYLASVVFRLRHAWPTPTTLVGTDSHTTMINGLGVLGWGVGGIEAEACMLGQPISMLLPPVVGFKLHGRLPEGCTATDLVLTITQMLRKKGVVGKFVEFYGPGLSALSASPTAPPSPTWPLSMARPWASSPSTRKRSTTLPSPIATHGRARRGVYQGAGHLPHRPNARSRLRRHAVELDLATVTPSMAGPKRPQDRVELPGVRKNFHDAFQELPKTATATIGDESVQFSNGAVVIAAITSCTNTSNPSVMLAAGLLAKKAVERGLKSKPWVKTSLAPGSKVVMDYYKAAGLIPTWSS